MKKKTSRVKILVIIFLIINVLGGVVIVLLSPFQDNLDSYLITGSTQNQKEAELIEEMRKSGEYQILYSYTKELPKEYATDLERILSNHRLESDDYYIAFINNRLWGIVDLRNMTHISSTKDADEILLASYDAIALDEQSGIYIYEGIAESKAYKWESASTSLSSNIYAGIGLVALLAIDAILIIAIIIASISGLAKSGEK